MGKKTRLDQLLVERRLAASRERARALILAGQVRVDGAPARKAGDLVAAEAEIALDTPDHPYVGRGGVKLAHALDAFGIAVEGRLALDVGASTGGFTDVLLRRGARRVVALDVGHGQLDWSLRQDPRVVALERVNARTLTAAALPRDARRFGVVTIDVSFISLAYVLPAVPPLLEADADVVALVKPQFEAGRDEVGAGGIVRDPALHERVIAGVTAAADRIGLTRVALTPSPIEGAEGNREFFLHLKAKSVAIERVGLVAKHGLHAASGVLADVAAWLHGRGIRIVFESETAKLAGVAPGDATASRDDLPTQVDLLVVLGGDGTLLGMAGRIAQAGVDVPILGVNFGGLGFLTEVTLDHIRPALEAALAGRPPLDERLMLRGRVIRDGRARVDRIALNDIVVTRGALSRIIALSVSVGDEFVTRVRADGLIIASPTGSTAYNLAAGGPIVHSAVDALVLTPIAPHMLTNRPVVIPARAEVRVAPVANGQSDIVVTFDGQFGVPLDKEDVVVVSRAEHPLRLVRSASRTYFEVLREKLKWGER